MDAHNPYEKAFQAYLLANGLGYVAVDESRRACLDDEPVKSLDFIVHGPSTAHWLIDVKGRRFPTMTRGRPRRVWECWSTIEDVDGLERWSARFGAGYRGLLVFAYQVAADEPMPAETEDLWHWRGRRYLLRAVPVEDYRRHMRPRSPRWHTVTLPTAAFRALARPFRHFLNSAPLV